MSEKYVQITPCYSMPESEFNKIKERQQAADALGKFFRKSDDEYKVCACLGLGCGDTGCGVWWDLFLQSHKDEFIKAVLDIVYKE